MHLFTGKHLLARLFCRLPLCYGNLLQNSSALSGRTLRQSGRFNSEPCLKLLVNPNTATGNLLYLVKDRPLLLPQEDEGQEVMGISCSGRQDGKILETWWYQKWQWTFFCFEKNSSHLSSILLPKHSCISEMPAYLVIWPQSKSWLKIHI